MVGEGQHPVVVHELETVVLVGPAGVVPETEPARGRDAAVNTHEQNYFCRACFQTCEFRPDRDRTGAGLSR